MPARPIDEQTVPTRDEIAPEALATIKARPAVERAYALAKRINDAPAINDAASRRILFEQDQNTVR